MPFLSIPWHILFYKLLGNKTRLNRVFAVVGRTKQSYEIPVVQDAQAGSVNAQDTDVCRYRYFFGNCSTFGDGADV